MTLMAVVSLWLSALPAAWAAPLSVLLGLAALRRWRQLARQPRRRLVIGGVGPVATVDGLPVADLQVAWQGALARVSWRRGPGARRQGLLFWPDTLPAGSRRELRLAACRRAVSPLPPGMAP